MSSLPIESGLPRESSYWIEGYDFNHWIQTTRKNGVIESEVDIGPYSSGYYADAYIGYDVPNFHKRKNAGELLPYTWYLNIQHSMSATGVRNNSHWLGGNFYEVSNACVAGPDKPILFRTESGLYDTSLSSRAVQVVQERGIDPRWLVQKAAAKLYSRGWDALTWLAELHKTLGLLKSSIFKLNRFLEEFKKYHGGKATAGQLLSNLDPTLDEWLETRYGWRLLLYDIQDISAVFARLDEEQKTRTKQQTGVSHDWDDYLSFQKETAVYRDTYTDIRYNDLSVRGKIIADFMPASVSLNPFATFWELIPYSFVVDWIYGIGQAINSLSFLVINDLYTACYGFSYQVRREASLFTESLNPGWVFESEQTVLQNYVVNHRRPVFVPQAPKFKLNLDAYKFIDLVALVDGLLRGKLLYY